MTATLTLRSTYEPELARPEIPTGCPSPAICQCPEHPSGVVLMFYASRRGAPASLVDNLAAELRCSGLATVLVDLTPGSRGEPLSPSPRPLLVDRAKRVIAWLGGQSSLAGLPLGLLGVNGAAGAALAAAGETSRAEAVVIWGGEPDQAEEALGKVRVPVLLLARGTDPDALHHHQSALVRLGGIKRLVAITRAGRAGDGMGEVAEAARWSAIWFVHHLAMERRWRHARS